MILKNQIPISLLVLSLVLIYVNCDKTCVMQGLNGYMFLGPLLNAEDLPPLKLEGNFSKNFKRLCPNIKNNKNLVCCDAEQLDFIDALANRIYEFNVTSCTRNHLDLLCQIHCNPKQNEYVTLLNKSESYNHYKGKFDVDQISAKIDLNFVNNFYDKCANAGLIFQDNHTLSELFPLKTTPASLLFLMFNYYTTHVVDFRFHDLQKNKSFHFDIDYERNQLIKKPIVDNKKILPLAN